MRKKVLLILAAILYIVTFIGFYSACLIWFRYQRALRIYIPSKEFYEARIVPAVQAYTNVFPLVILFSVASFISAASLPYLWPYINKKRNFGLAVSGVTLVLSLVFMIMIGILGDINISELAPPPFPVEVLIDYGTTINPYAKYIPFAILTSFLAEIAIIWLALAIPSAEVKMTKKILLASLLASLTAVLYVFAFVGFYNAYQIWYKYQSVRVIWIPPREVYQAEILPVIETYQNVFPSVLLRSTELLVGATVLLCLVCLLMRNWRASSATSELSQATTYGGNKLSE